MILRILILTLSMTVIASAATIPESFDLRIEGKPISALVERIAKQCDAGLLIHPSARERLKDPATIDATNVSWSEVRNLFSQRYRIDVNLRENRIEAIDADQALRFRVVTRYYDLSGFIQNVQERRGEALGVMSGGENAGAALMAIAPGEAIAISRFEDVQQMVKTQDQGSWEDEGKDGCPYRIKIMGGVLAVTHVPEVQERVATLIEHLERMRSRQVLIRCWLLPKPTQALAPTMDAAAWKSQETGGARLIGGFVARDGQRNHQRFGNVQSAIVDSDVNQHIHMPIMITVKDGLMFEALPHIVGDRIQAQIHMQAAGDTTTTPMPLLDEKGKAIMKLDQIKHRVETSTSTHLIPRGGAALCMLGGECYAITADEVTPGR